MNEKIVLYSTGCPKCGVLKRKLDSTGIQYDVVSDVDEMLKLGMSSAPFLGVDGELLDFNKAMVWIRSQEAGE
jgi:glutaredoxin-related protein